MPQIFILIIFTFETMASGNFLIGNTLSMAGFDQYVKRPLTERGYTISDYVGIEDDGTAKVLAAISGEGDLEKVLHEVMGTNGRELFEAQRRGDKHLTAYQYQLGDMCRSVLGDFESPLVPEGYFSTLGIYSDAQTASALFPNLAQGYLFGSIQKKAEEYSDLLKEMGKKLSEL